MPNIIYKEIGQLSRKDTIAGTEKIVVSDTEFVTPSQIAGLVDVSSKQDTLESGVNIKTINNQSILGAGNINLATKEEVDQLDQDVDNLRTDVGEKSTITVRHDIATSQNFTNSGKVVIADSNASNFGYNATSSNYSATGYIDVSDYVGKNLHFTLPSTTAASSTYGTVFYSGTTESSAISGITLITGAAANGFELIEVTVPENATKVRFSFRTAALANFEAYIEETKDGDYTSGLGKRVRDIEGIIWERVNLVLTGLPTMELIINSQDSWESNANYASVLIPIVPGSNIRVQAPSNTNKYIAFLTSNRTNNPPDFCDGYSSRIQILAGATYEGVIPSDAAYMYLSNKKTDDIQDTIVYYVINTVETLEKEVQIIGEDVKGITPEKVATYSQKYINKDTGELVQASSTVSYVNEYNSIVAGSGYRVSGYVGANLATCLGAFYDQEGTFISSFDTSIGAVKIDEDFVVVAPIDAAKMRVFGRDGAIQADVRVETMRQSLTRALDLSWQVKNRGKSIAVFGGSHSVRKESEAAKNIWRDILQMSVFSAGIGGTGFVNSREMYAWEYNGKVVFTRYDFTENMVWDADGYLSELTISSTGEGSIVLSDGNTYTRKATDDYTANVQVQIERFADNGELDKEIYLLWVSTNDYTNGQPLGNYNDYTADDNYDTSKIWVDSEHGGTVCGGFNRIIKIIREENPTAEIYVFNSFRFFNHGKTGYDAFTSATISPNTLNFYNYTQEIMKAAKVAGCAILDQFILQGVDIHNYTQYYKSDNLHMNEAGYEKIGWMQASFLANGK